MFEWYVKKKYTGKIFLYSQLPVLPLLKKRFNVMYLSVEWSTLTGQVTMVQIGPNFSSYYLLCVTF